MKLTAKLAYSQIKTNRSRTIWTLIGIALSTAMITAVFGFAASGHEIMMEAAGGNEFYMKMYNRTLLGLGSFFSSIVVAASVIVVSNTFRVSAGERTRQFGILKSAGATKKQIAQIIMYEGFYFCLIGIPAGIAFGLVVNFTGIQIVNYFTAGLAALNDKPLVVEFVFAWQAMILSIAVSFFTVLLSTWLPARKAAKIAAIDAIRGAGEVKIKANQVRGGRIVGKLFGFEGTLASKSLKRSKRNFRATVISLTVSITLFIIVGSFGALMKVSTSSFYPGIDATIFGSFYASSQNIYDDNGETIGREYNVISGNLGNQITEQLREYPDTKVFGAGTDSYIHETVVPKDALTPKMREAETSADMEVGDMQEYTIYISFMVIDKENYAMLCERAGVPVGSNILVNRYNWYQDGGREVIEPFVFENQVLRITSEDGGEFDLPLHGELAGQDIPGEVHYAVAGISVIVPEADVMRYSWFAKPADKDGFTEYAYSVLNDSLLREGIGILDIEAAVEAQQGLSRLIMTFIYGFIALLTLIGLTNVVSTISANIRSRAREFAILKSVGMEQRGINRMLNLESVLCSLKSLAFGLTLGVIGSYITFKNLDTPVELTYSFPLIPVVQCAVGVFAITWIIMRHAAARLNDGNIIETIRGDSGM